MPLPSFFLSDVTDIPVGIGAPFPDPAERGGVCAWANLGIAMKDECLKEDYPIIEDGLAHMAEMIIASGRDDWHYLVVGGQSSLQALIQTHPIAAAMIDTVIVMAGNWCGGFEPYPGVMAPTDETNIACDPGSANFVLDSNNIKFNNIYYVPVALADEISGRDYETFVDAANSGNEPAAAATLEWYKIWSSVSRADETLLVHAEAMAYDPETESTPQFDPAAVMLLIELLEGDHCEKRISLFEFPAIHFSEPGDDGLKQFPESPRSAFSLYPEGTMDGIELPAECPELTSHTFDPNETTKVEYPVMVALGFTSGAAKNATYRDMALRLAGQVPVKHCVEDDGVDSDSTSGARFIRGKSYVGLFVCAVFLLA